MSIEKNNSDGMSFWEHLDILRGYLFRMALVTVALAVVCFFFKELSFNILLAPKDSNFITYRLFSELSTTFMEETPTIDDFSVQLINTGLAEQFMMHMKVSMYGGLLLAFPYILYLLFEFISPALYSNERRYVVRIVGSSYIMFILGVLLNYFLIFPFTFRFLGTYQVSSEVTNMITLQSYMDTLMMLSIMMGMVFEIPILSWLFGKLGFLSADFMRKYRKHAAVTILIIAAVITPTSDVFTLLLVSLPMYLLYEVSILVVPTGSSQQMVETE